MQDWEWSERYPSQPELLRYLDHVADRFDLRRDIELDTRVAQARYDAEQGAWQLTTHDGTRCSATFCIMACGCLSSPHRPAIEGLDDYEGDCYHSARWPHGGVELAGRRVGVIGTGSSGIQLIPRVAEQADRVYAFQRTPNFSMPARTQPLDPDTRRALKSGYRERRRLARESLSGVPSSHPGVPQRSALAVTPEERTRVYEDGWTTGGISGVTPAFNDIITDAEANATAADFVREKIRGLVRDNVTLVDVRDAPIVRLTPRGVQTASAEYDLDVIIFATGFDAIEATPDAEDAWLAHVDEVAQATLFPRANSWYAGANIPGKPRVFMPYLGGVAAYRAHCDAVADSGYDGFSVAA